MSVEAAKRQALAAWLAAAAGAREVTISELAPLKGGAIQENWLLSVSLSDGPFAGEQKAYPEHALSDITFDRTMQFHINGETIELLHVGPAHTDGDTAVIFRGVNAVHLGDVFNNAGYPFIDADNGGDLAGMIAFCQAVHDAIDDDTKVIPGHGPVTDRAKLARYIEVLTIIQGRVQALIDDGKSLEEIMAVKPTADFDTEFQANAMMLPSFLSRVYASLMRK